MSQPNGLAALKGAWTIGGSILEKRELTSQKNATWRGYVIKVQSLGATFEIGVAAELFARVNQGELWQFGGHFEDQQGRLKLVGEAGQPMKTAA